MCYSLCFGAKHVCRPPDATPEHYCYLAWNIYICSISILNPHTGDSDLNTCREAGVLSEGGGAGRGGGGGESLAGHQRGIFFTWIISPGEVS